MIDLKKLREKAGLSQAQLANRVGLTQAQISRDRLQRKVGSAQQVLVDSVDGDQATGRSMADAPEIDGIVSINSALGLKPGDMVEVKIEAADDYDLTGTRITR